jgi:hypothetical protein
LAGVEPVRFLVVLVVQSGDGRQQRLAFGFQVVVALAILG